MSGTTSNLQVSMIVPVCEQRFWQFSQVGLEYCSCVIGVEITRFEIQLSSSIQHLPQGCLSQAVAWYTEQPLHMKVYEWGRKIKTDRQKKKGMQRDVVSRRVDTRHLDREVKKRVNEMNEERQ